MTTTFKKVHYRVLALQDGTIYLVTPTRKPRVSRTSGVPEIDEDAIYQWYLDKPEDEEHLRFSDWGKGVWQTCTAMSLNVKRIVRQQVENRLDTQKNQIAAVQTQLVRIEEKLNRLLAANGDS
jgi:hypothetical protein